MKNDKKSMTIGEIDENQWKSMKIDENSVKINEIDDDDDDCGGDGGSSSILY